MKCKLLLATPMIKLKKPTNKKLTKNMELIITN